jgi:hypothetical protein
MLYLTQARILYGGIMAIDGVYQVEMNTPMGKQQAKLILKTSGNSLSGTMENPLGNAEFSGGTINGADIAWKVELQTPIGKMSLNCKGNIQGSEITGEVVVGSFGSFPFTGKKAA